MNKNAKEFWTENGVHAPNLKFKLTSRKPAIRSSHNKSVSCIQKGYHNGRASDLIHLIRKPSKLWPSLNSCKKKIDRINNSRGRSRGFNDGLSLDGFLDHELNWTRKIMLRYFCFVKDVGDIYVINDGTVSRKMVGMGKKSAVDQRRNPTFYPRKIGKTGVSQIRLVH